MNETIKNILERRSIRNFKDEQLTEEQTETIINCALSSPTAKNMQEWYFAVIQDEEVRKLLPPNCFNAPTVILIFGEQDNKWTNYDIGIATENIVIAAKSLGLDTCIVGTIKNKMTEEILSHISVPENYSVEMAISIGYANEEPREKEFQKNKCEII